MSETGTRSSYATEGARVEAGRGWGGFLQFGAVMLLVTGAFHVFAGLIAFFDDTYFVTPSGELVVSADYPAWGWVLLAVGVAAVAAGFGILYGRTWARLLGVVVAAISALVNLAFVAASPWMALTIVVFDVLVIYALLAHGRELQQS